MAKSKCETTMPKPLQTPKRLCQPRLEDFSLLFFVHFFVPLVLRLQILLPKQNIALAFVGRLNPSANLSSSVENRLIRLCPLTCNQSLQGTSHSSRTSCNLMPPYVLTCLRVLMASLWLMVNHHLLSDGYATCRQARTFDFV